MLLKGKAVSKVPSSVFSYRVIEAPGPISPFSLAKSRLTRGVSDANFLWKLGELALALVLGLT